MISDNPLFSLLIMLVSMFTSGFCSGMESSYLSMDRIAIKKLEKSRSPISKLVLFYVDHLNQFIASILIFNLLSNIVGTLSANTLFFWYLREFWNWESGSNSIGGIAFEFIFIILFTLMILIFSEFVPKRITILHPKFFAQLGSLPMIFVYTVMYPAVFIIFQFSNLLKRLFTMSTKPKNSSINSEKKNLPVYRHELLGFVEKISSQGGFHKLETDWLVHLLFYMNTPISNIMINRENLEGIDFNSLNGNNVQPLIMQFPFSNIPIYQESKDNILGIISKKEVIHKHRQNFLNKEELNKYIHKALLLPKNKNVMDVLRDIYHYDLEIALITDEHGGVEGIVTANHIITRIFERVGNEENDTFQIRHMSANVFSVGSEVSLDDINQFFGINLKSENFKSIGGYLLEKFKYIPKKGEIFEDNYFTYVVKSCTPKKIVRIDLNKK